MRSAKKSAQNYSPTTQDLSDYILSNYVTNKSSRKLKEQLLLLHGALGSKGQFSSLREKLEAFFDIHMISFAGHGGIASSKAFSIDLFTENVIDYLHEKSIHEVSIFGYSMGGYVALNTSLKIPGKIKKIITLATKFNWTMESASKEVKMLNPMMIEEKVPHFAEKLKQEHHPLDWKSVVEKTASMMINLAKSDKLDDSDFEKIVQKVVIGIGSLDNMVSYEESEYVSRILPNSTLITLEGVKHPIDKISVDELAHFIRSNLKTSPQSS